MGDQLQQERPPADAIPHITHLGKSWSPHHAANYFTTIRYSGQVISTAVIMKPFGPK
jgi:hypothetical protein